MQYLDNFCVPTIVYFNSENTLFCVTFKFFLIEYKCFTFYQCRWKDSTVS